MRVHVLLFAAFREAAGSSRLELDLPTGATLDDLFRELAKRYVGMQPLRAFTTFAVNREVQPAETLLHDGDEVAFLQPVSGGCEC